MVKELLQGKEILETPMFVGKVAESGPLNPMGHEFKTVWAIMAHTEFVHERSAASGAVKAKEDRHDLAAGRDLMIAMARSKGREEAKKVWMRRAGDDNFCVHTHVKILLEERHGKDDAGMTVACVRRCDRSQAVSSVVRWV